MNLLQGKVKNVGLTSEDIYPFLDLVCGTSGLSGFITVEVLPAPANYVPVSAEPVRFFEEYNEDKSKSEEPGTIISWVDYFVEFDSKHKVHLGYKRYRYDDDIWNPAEKTFVCLYCLDDIASFCRLNANGKDYSSSDNWNEFLEWARGRNPDASRKEAQK